MNTSTVLLVDDNQDILNAVRAVLDKHFNVLTAIDGRKALAIIESQKVNCVILDIVMPQMNGLEVLKEIRYAHGELPVIIVTGKSCQKYAECCADLRVGGYILKPFNVEDLIFRITGLIELTRDSSINSDDLGIYIHPKVKEVLDYIHHNYKCSLDRKKLSFQCGISYHHLGAMFKEEVGMALNTYVNMFRIKKSKEFLSDPDKSVCEVMEMAGFNCAQHFFRQFKKHTGVTPLKYRNQMFKNSRHAFFIENLSKDKRL